MTRRARSACRLAAPWLLALAAASAAGSALATSTPWAQLSPAERRVLAPLASQWAGLDADERAEWRAVAERLPRLPATEQARMQQRMQDWARMSPASRGQARLQFKQAQRWSAEERRQRWEAYQSLDPQAREVLAERWRLDGRPAPDAPPAGKRNLVQTPPRPAAPPQAATATAVRARTGATTKPLTRETAPPAHHQIGLPKVIVGDAFVDPGTLLPRRGPQGAAVVAPAAAVAAPPAARAAGRQGSADPRRPMPTSER